MSVVCENSRGWVLDSRSLIDQGYSHCIRSEDDRKSSVQCRFKEQCFRVLKSHICVAPSACVDGGNTDTVHKAGKLPKKRKRRRSELNQGEIDSRTFHEKIRPAILEGTESLVESARSLGYLDGTTDAASEPLPSQECGLAALSEMAKDLPLVEEREQRVQQLPADDGRAAHFDLFSRVTENGTDFAAVVPLLGDEYVIPPRSAFLLSDFSRLEPLVRCGRRFDLIVMDPPWENKSVKRKRGYSCLSSTQLKRLPVPTLASPNCLVATWVTNRQSHLRFVRDELYPHWGVEVPAEWFWVKVTTSGQFVFPLDSNHKKPYEVLVLGRYRSSTVESSSQRSAVPLEDRRLIVSIPSALHSQKPPLAEVLKPYVGTEAKRLELFARSLQPGWTSWGNEVLKFQRTSYFHMTPTDDGGSIPEDEAADGTAANSPALSSPGESPPPCQRPTDVD
ncbi:N(6)-adenine-specific methyltransferase METTL4 [Brachionichthys hirsutus]|uniref:N(6)-adenine-specific methyltransferase METTL4 n=1 Tax=Brachionichthys hirsutus TaxID=412623 RepID=UPI003604CD52